jgi:hypothetical protein
MATAVAAACAGVSTIEQLERRALLSADFVLDWNAVALQAVADDHTPSLVAKAEQGGPTRTARALAIVHAAIFDAANSIAGAYTPYLVNGHGPKDASIEAAIAQAAHDALVVLYPSQVGDFDAALAASLAQVPDGSAEKQGVNVGRQVAKAILKARLHDGSELDVKYSEAALPGVYEWFPDEPLPLDPGWGDVTPFTMASVADFISDPPPAMDSDAYATAYNEVKNYGSDDVTFPTLRTPEQTEIGIYWAYDGTPGLGTPPRLYNQIARVIAEQEGNTQLENARLFALINFAIADAGVASWGTKYTYDVWRPMRGIRQISSAGVFMDDGNGATEADLDWLPLGAPCTNCPAGSTNFTPPFPAYTSGHATFGAAAFRTLANFYGTDAIPFTFVSDELNGVNEDVDGSTRLLRPRSFTSFSQAAEENGQSRIYLGIHWAFDKTAGIEQGNAIADYAFANFLQPAANKKHGDVHHDHHIRPDNPKPRASAARDVLSDDDGERDDDLPGHRDGTGSRRGR